MTRNEAAREARGLQEPWLIMHHPYLEDSYKQVTVDAFEEVWADQGWQKADGLVDEYGDPVLVDEPDPNQVEAEPPAPTGKAGEQKSETSDAPQKEE